MRIALLPAGGDPFLLAYWLRHYARVWAYEVDELHVHMVGQSDPAVLGYIGGLAAELPHVRFSWQPSREPHGQVLARMTESAGATDLLLFCEDDAFVRHPGVIDARFHMIGGPGSCGTCGGYFGEYDVVGTARGNATPNLIARAEELFGPSPTTASGETGLSLYPCFLFIQKRKLPPGHFDGMAWQAGDYIPELDYTCSGEEACDTFTYASWKLRAAGLRIHAEAAYRSDSAHAPKPGHRTVDGGSNTGDAPWFHVGSLSSGYGCAFMVQPDPVGLWESVARPHERIDWTKRMSWWQRAWERWDGALPELHAQYGADLARFRDAVGMDPEDIADWRARYDPLVSWDDRP